MGQVVLWLAPDSTLHCNPEGIVDWDALLSCSLCRVKLFEMRSIHKSRGCWPPLSRHYSSVTWTRTTIPHVFEREIPSIAPYLAQICQARRNHKNMHSSVLVKLGLQVFAVGDILYIQAGSLSSEPSPCSRVTIATESIDSY